MDSDRPLDFTYPVACRIRRRHEYQLLFRTGRRIALPHFVIYYAFRESGPSRLGTTVSRKVGNAVVRNCCKRQLREFFRLNRSYLVQPVDLSILARSGSARLTSHQIHSELLDGLARAALIVLP